MPRFLANENFPRDAILQLRATGFDVTWMVEIRPGASDEQVLELARSEERVLLSFDKDFGELVFKGGDKRSRGIILFRIQFQSSESVVSAVLDVMRQPLDWERHFSVVRESAIRMVPLPKV